MGIIGSFIKSVVIEHAIVAVADIMQTKSEQKIKSEFNKNDGTEVLVISRDNYSWKDKFYIYDEYQNIKYSVKGEFFTIKPCLNIFDSKGKIIACVKEKLISFRFPTSFESNPIDFELILQGRKMGKLKSRFGFGKQILKVDFNGWQIEGDLLGWKYRILNGNKQVAKISQQILNFNDTYIINFIDKKDELIILMLVLAIASMSRH